MAIETRNAARATVEELHKQEQQMKRIDGQYEEVSCSYISTSLQFPMSEGFGQG